MNIIISMTAQNFLSFGDAEFYFEEAGPTFVEGDNLDDPSANSNGSGKSAMIDALVWCLFGTTLRGYENDEVVNRKAGENCLVTVRFTPKDRSVLYEVSRARKHKQQKNALRVVEVNRGGDSDDISRANNSETQELVEKLLGCTLRMFMSSVVFGQDRAYRFSSLTDKEQKEILDEVLGVERFAHAYDEARTAANKLSDHVETQRHGFERAEEAIADVERELKDARKRDASFEDDRKRKLEEERSKLTKANEWVKKNVKLDQEKLVAAADKMEKTVASLDKEVAKSSKLLREAEVERAGIAAKVEELRSNIKKHEKLVGDCPTCGQRVDDIQHERVLKDLKKALALLTKKYDNSDATTSALDHALDEVQGKLTEARKALTVAQRAIADNSAAEANAKAWKQRAVDHEKRIVELQDEKNPFTGLIERMQKRVEKHRAEAEIFRTQLTEAENSFKHVDFWVKAFGQKGLRSLLLDTSLPLLNEEASRLTRAVTGGTISIEFSATSDLKSGKTVDRFEVRVDNKHGAGTYQGNSAGERAKVDLCVGLALQRLVASRSSASFNVVFFDEVFDHLDAAAHERVIEVISEIEKESVFVVSHNEDLKAWFPASLRIVKKDGFSSVDD